MKKKGKKELIYNNKPNNFNPAFEVVSCFIEYNGEILLLKRQIHKPQPNTYGVPAGKVEKNENLIDAIIREVKEETNIELDINNIEFFKTKYVVYDEYAFTYHSFHYDLVNKPKVKINEEEHQEYMWITPEESLNLNLIEDEDSCILDYYNLKLKDKK